MLKKTPMAYGGDLLKKASARLHGRTLDTRNTMHFVLRSSKATGDWSFRRHRGPIKNILDKFANRYGVRLLSMANVGNHLHIHLRLTNRHTYRAFIRAVSAAIMMKVTGTSRWTRIKSAKGFWDRRPYSRVIVGWLGILRLRDYLQVNQLEGLGYSRNQAKFFLAWERAKVGADP
jgi:REP element-mobilizing transposase RayT